MHTMISLSKAGLIQVVTRDSNAKKTTCKVALAAGCGSWATSEVQLLLRRSPNFSMTKS
jgi:hypothetical protein